MVRVAAAMRRWRRRRGMVEAREEAVRGRR